MLGFDPYPEAVGYVVPTGEGVATYGEGVYGVESVG